MVGILNVNKPAGPTSAAVVGRLRRSSGERRVGHGGTLDPMASGVLPIFFGRATVLASHLGRQDKAYRAEVTFGAHSSTDDAEGVLTPAPKPLGLSAEAIEAALAGHVGTRPQRPPAYSALKVDGQRSYAVARREGHSRPEPLAPRMATVHALSLRGISDRTATIEVVCGSGFYVRALARDLGAQFDTGAYLVSLVRTRVGVFGLDTAVTLEGAEQLGAEVAARLRSGLEALGDLPVVAAAKGVERELGFGRSIPVDAAVTGEAAVVDGERVLALGVASGGLFQPRKLVQVGEGV